MDEILIQLLAPLVKCWMKRGQQRRIPMVTATRKSQAMAGVLNWRTQTVHCQELTWLNSEALIAYFEWLFNEVYPSQTIVMVMDNASFHHSYALKAALSLYEHRVIILWLPPYSPDLNPIERFWKHLKANACSNYLYSSVADLLHSVHTFIQCHNQPNHDLRLSFSKNF